ncbi:DUF1294 domain-containing protein [Maritalea sp.]|uniref:DUF1294 domain-containing protein n=1 Tax=Maritalea sp. TaxID=2003361 RepID=UPI003EF46AC9
MAFGAFALDKHFAEKHMRRISERSLLTLAMLGGTIGAIAGQHILRHKTYKQPFKTILFVIPIVHIAIIALLWLAQFLELL